MKVIKLDQNTDQWLEERRKFIGGSDIPAIMGVSPYASPLMVWRDKMGLPTERGPEFLFAKGHRLEEIARAQANIFLDCEYRAMVVRNSSLEFCQVSLDGFNYDEGRQLEIKYMGEKSWKLVEDQGFVPEHYLIQVQYQLIATGFPMSDFVAINDDHQIAITEVSASPARFKQITDHAEAFYYDHMLKKQPPPPTRLDTVKVEDLGLMRALSKLQFQKNAKAPKKLQDKTRSEVKHLMTHCKMEYNGTRLSLSEAGQLRVTFPK